MYYQYSSMKLEQWHPNHQQILLGATLAPRHIKRGNQAQSHSFSHGFYTQTDEGCYCDVTKMSDSQYRLCRWIVDLLEKTDHRQGNYACFGMHEWAMVYRGSDIRHETTTPLRLPQETIDEVVESRPILCSHFDAFRFFTLEAKPLNKLNPTIANRPQLEQPSCIHANMDLYKWAFKSMPWIGSELLMDCFNLAMQARTIDMRASPYDLRAYGEFPPLQIETAAGRQEYQCCQRAIAEAAKPLRRKLIEAIEQVCVSYCAITK